MTLRKSKRKSSMNIDMQHDPPSANTRSSEIHETTRVYEEALAKCSEKGGSPRISKKSSVRKINPPDAMRSPYFNSKRKCPFEQKNSTTQKNVSCVPFPPLDSPGFGLVQERLWQTPFNLLLACIFLNKTRGAVAMPIFYQMIADYPKPEDLAIAELQDVVAYFANLGLQNQRAKKVISMAKVWCSQPPSPEKRYRSLHYPQKGDGKDIKRNECIDEADTRVGWEIAHLPGIGAYGYDSWRIFCRDHLRELPEDVPEMDREWTRVIPLDKELRAYLRWRWLKLGWIWDPLTGQRRKAEERELLDAQHGGVIIETDAGDRVESAGP